MSAFVAPFEAYQGNEPYIYVSYEHKDSNAVFPHLNKLRKEGYRIWYDEGIAPGTNWSDEIATAILNASCILVFMSPEASVSRDVKNDIVFALSKKKLMVCVYLSETMLPLGMQMQLGNVTTIYEYRFEDKDKFYERLLKLLPDYMQEAEL